MPINWQDPAVKDRLLAAIIGSFDNKINCREVARLFGGEATYNAIENFLRGPKKMAQSLKKEAKDDIPPSPAKPRTPKKLGSSLLNGVKAGRVAKTPGKFKGPPVKELIDHDTDDGGDVEGLSDA
ncbi:uncharacterized protein BDR25DRAFT_311534 [Lindgomyces ingoldianus]|uniref:Uncharacterized protein n=1 Tax=Lindgomyces ingoldianus TaxID=673940 RepID=A0ACB6R4G9_9PLEO|nr:uncharacterized protein BDR25DRAFT_311534 [Lindgomyces ingoldianus]KAF2474144.1 hypothetical protein BDR25DRAFT_311534 [Lindgomyces ingoldianus]